VVTSVARSKVSCGLSLSAALSLIGACDERTLNLGSSDPEQTADAAGTRTRRACFSAAEAANPRVPKRDGCPLVGCGSTITLRAPISDAVATLPALLVEVCFNEACVAGTLPTFDAGGRWGVSFPRPLDREEAPSVSVSIIRSPGASVFFVDCFPPSSSDLRDGDRFSVTARDPASNVVFSVMETLGYVESYPNGKDCDLLPCCTAALNVETILGR
jgi:hypothetical protein